MLTLVIVFIFGSILGSFALCAAQRFQLGMSILNPKRSICPRCGVTLAALENIPVISYIILRGKCGHCGKQIGLKYFVVEVVSGLLAVCLVLLFA